MKVIAISQEVNILIKYIKVCFIITTTILQRFSVTGVELLYAPVVSHMQVLLKAAIRLAFGKASPMK